MNLKTLTVGPLEANCYLIWNDNACVLIDPGEEPERIKEAIVQLGRPLEAILLTHGHFDHVGAAAALKEAYPGVPIMVGAADEEILSHPDRAYKGMLPSVPPHLYLKADRLLEDGETVDVNGMRFTVIHTPGHTRGSVCYLYEKAFFSGDTLFRGSCGRCDLYGGDSRQMSQSLAKLAALKGDWDVFCGHGAPTTMENERKHNYFMRRQS